MGVMSRGCPFGFMGSSDECLGCHSVHPRLESRLKFRVCVPREGQLNFRAGDFDQAVPLFVRVFPTPSVIDTSAISDELRLRMALPCELVDEIVTHLRCDERALRNCSLVARSWTYPSQKLLYARICITPETYKTWQEIASPTSAELFHHVLSLTFSRFQSLYALHEYHLESFHRLRHLALHNIGDIESNTVDLFPAFQNTLSSLSLHRVRLTLDTFIKLLGYFPNLKQLTLHDSAFDPERWATPLPSTPPRGKLTLSALSEEDTGALLWGLRQLEPEYDELNFLEVYGNSIHSIISTCNKTLKRLQLSRRVCKFHTIFKTSRALSNPTPWFSSVFHSHSREPPATARTHVPLITLCPKRSLPHIDHYLHEPPEDCVRSTPKSKRPALAVPRHKAVHSGRSIARIGIRTHSRIGVSSLPRVCSRDFERGS